MDISDLLDYVDRELNLADTEAQEIYAALLRLQDIDNTKLPDGGDASMWEKFWSFAQLGRVLFANMSRTEAEAAIDKSMKEQK